jgi:SAM-dependent methyltransferase
MTASIKAHWEQIYAAGDADSVSWFQKDPTPSLDLIVTAGVAPDAAILDVGGGASLLVDRLLDRGFSSLSVLDVSGQALAMAKARLGPRAASVRWVEADATAWEPPAGEFTLWHDRAVFHFLTEAADRDAYLRSLDGPERCSGLAVQRYSAATLQATLGPAFELIKATSETHLTPTGAHQAFVWGLFAKLA